MGRGSLLLWTGVSAAAAVLSVTTWDALKVDPKPSAAGAGRCPSDIDRRRGAAHRLTLWRGER